MPVSENCPEPLKTALQEMEAIVKSKRSSISYAAPEMQDLHWEDMKSQLAGCLETLYSELAGES